MLSVRFIKREYGMKTVWMAGFAVACSATALAQTTIYKHVDDSGRITYSNKPMKGATVVDLEPITIIPMPAPASTAGAKSNFTIATDKGSPTISTASLTVEKPSKAAQARPVQSALAQPGPTLASIDTQTQKRRDDERRRILEDELAREEQSLSATRGSIAQEQQNPTLVAAVRAAQQMGDPSPAQLAEVRNNLDRASGRIRGLQATAAEHEKNIEALKKELGALKP
jgi:hypothetical protein